MLKRIIASTSLLLYLLLPFFNIQMMNVFYPNFLRNSHTALLAISILFILNIVLTILVITLSIKTNLLESRMITVGIYLFIGLLLLVLIIGIPKILQTFVFSCYRNTVKNLTSSIPFSCNNLAASRMVFPVV